MRRIRTVGHGTLAEQDFAGPQARRRPPHPPPRRRGAAGPV